MRHTQKLKSGTIVIFNGSFTSQLCDKREVKMGHSKIKDAKKTKGKSCES